MIEDALHAAGFQTSPPVSFYSSPLKRCISTTEEVIEACQLEKRLTVVDSFREWMGYDHTEYNDRRDTRTEILRDTQSRGFQTAFSGPFPEADRMFERRPLRETYTDVDIRWEDSLNRIFETDSNNIVCICSNNRAIQSSFRVIGHEASPQVLRSNFGIMNMRNGAVVALLVTRVAISPEESRKIQESRSKCREVELEMIRRQKNIDDDKAVVELTKLTERKFKEFILAVRTDQKHEVRRKYEEGKMREVSCKY